MVMSSFRAVPMLFRRIKSVGRKMIEVVGDLEQRNDATVYILKWQTGRERERAVRSFLLGRFQLLSQNQHNVHENDVNE